MYIQSVLEQSCVVWPHNISKPNESELERVQKVAVKIITGNKHNTYSENLKERNLETLKERRKGLSARFAEKFSRNPRTKKMFEHKEKHHVMKLRTNNKFKIPNVKTTRWKNSALPNMVNHLNEKHDEKLQLFRTLNIQ